MASKKTKNLDMYLTEVYKRYISIKCDNCKKAQAVFKEVFDQMKSKMGEQCNYFKKYSSHNMAAGSVYDGIKITKMDEFDMDIVIRLPISYEDSEEGILIENDQPGFVKMKIEKAFDNLVGQTEWERCHKVTRFWKDNDKYFLQNKFRQWLHSIVERAIRQLNGNIEVGGDRYLLTYSAPGPAYTLHVKNISGNEDFTLDVDLVPVIKFQVPRWPNGYRRAMNGSRADEWLVVPKPNKDIKDDILRNRCWRLSFQVFEKEMMTRCQNLKMTIRLVKKLRDSLGMTSIASYYIKTLFLWKIDKVKDRKYWNDRTSKLFREMVGELHDAIKIKCIPYFWNEEHNLISGIDKNTLEQYEMQLNGVIGHMDSNNIDGVICRVLNVAEFLLFKITPFYRNPNYVTCGSLSRPPSNESISNFSDDSLNTNQNKAPSVEELVQPMIEKIDSLSDKVEQLTKQVKKLEMEKKSKEQFESVSKSLASGWGNNLYDKVKPSTSKVKNSEMQNRYQTSGLYDEDFYDGDERPKRIKRDINCQK